MFENSKSFRCVLSTIYSKSASYNGIERLKHLLYRVQQTQKSRLVYISSTATKIPFMYFCIPFLGIARPQSQFPHSCVCGRFIYSQDRSAYFLQQYRQIGGGINRSQTHECGNWESGRAILFLGIFVSNFRYCFFAVCTP